MKLLRLEWSNFGSYYGEHHFDVDGLGLVLIEGDNQDESMMDSNGAGKSTIFDALDWCWFGTSRGLADEVFNDFAKVEGLACRVKTYLLDDDQTQIVIERGRKKSSTWLTLEKAGQDYSTLDTRQTQAEIERLLGMDEKAFHAAVLFAQSDLVHYADAKDTQRMDILTRILQLDSLDRALEKAKTVHKRIVEQQDNLNLAILGIEKELEGLRQIDYQSLISVWEQEQNDRLLDVRNRLGELVAKREALAIEILVFPNLQEQKAEVEAQLLNLREPQLGPSWEVQYKQAKAELLQYHKLFGADELEIKRLQAELHRWAHTQQGVCHECGQVITAEHLQQAIQRKQGDLSIVQTRMASTERILRQWQERVSAFEADYGKHQNTITQRKDDLDALLKKINAAIFSRTMKEEGVLNLEKQIQDLVLQEQSLLGAVCPHWEAQQRHVNQVEKLEGELEKEKASLVNVERALPYYAYWVDAFGKKGLKSYILDYKLQELTDAANQWVQLLTGGTFWIKFASQRKKAKGLVNAPDLRIYRLNAKGEVIERSYGNWSGGEKQRISFAVDFGLSRFMAQRATKNLSFLGLDEAFRHLDRSGKAAVVGLLRQLAREKDTVLVIEHDQEFAAQFDRRFCVVRKNDCSSFREVGT